MGNGQSKTGSGTVRLAIISDIHYASPQEAARKPAMYDPIRSSTRRWLVRQYRRWFWLHDPFAHNHLLDQFLDGTREADYAVANGDYSCDSAYVGVCDDAAFASASTCLERLRARFGGSFQATFGDHEIGKKMLAANEGGLRLASYARAVTELKLEPCWSVEIGRHVLIGVASTLAAWPMFEPEALPEERSDWATLHAEHLAAIGAAFDRVRPDQRILLFCHDPSALPFLARIEAVRRRWPQLERTVIGHLHSRLFLRLSAVLQGMPEIGFLGHTPRRLSRALRQARTWKPFRVLLCPSVSGLQLFKDGGYYVVHLNPDADTPARFEFKPLRWGRGG